MPALEGLRMDWQTLGAFMVATVVILATPGPVMATIVGNTLSGGRAIGLRTAVGIMLGESMLACVFAGSLLSSSRLLPGLFPWLSLVSAVYLAWLAASILLHSGLPIWEKARRYPHHPFLDGLAVTVSNPAALLFYAAFLMPFVRDAQPVAVRLGIFVTVFVLVGFIFDLACVLLIAQLSSRRITSEAFVRTTRFGSAIVYLGTSAFAVASFLHAFTP
jgi:threonine/homoserine/homoserine lactone efflux protein